jgi:hypothetical protein
MIPEHTPAAAQARPDDGGMAQQLRAMQQDPVANRTLVAWQGMAADAILKAIDMVTQQLTARSARPDEGGDPHDIIQVRARARRRQAQVQQCRELAQEMVLATVSHLSNPDWDPFAPGPADRHDGDAQAPADNILMMLLDLAQPAR